MRKIALVIGSGALALYAASAQAAEQKQICGTKYEFIEPIVAFSYWLENEIQTPDGGRVQWWINRQGLYMTVKIKKWPKGDRVCTLAYGTRERAVTS